MGGYKGGRAGQPHRGKNTAGGVLLHIPHFATLIKKKKKKSHRFALLVTEDCLLSRGVGVRTIVPGHSTPPLSVWCVYQTPRVSETTRSSERDPGRSPSLSAGAGASIGRGKDTQSYCSSLQQEQNQGGEGLLRAFIFNYSYLSYHSLSSGQTIAMATIISSNLYSLLIFCSTFAKHQLLRVQFTFYQSVLLAHAATVNVPYCTDTMLFNGLVFDDPQ